MKSLLVISLIVFVTRTNAYTEKTTLYVNYDQTGDSLSLTESVPDLQPSGFGNKLMSMQLTGIWVYYDNVNYNEIYGSVYIGYGLDTETNLPDDYCNTTSSIRLVKSKLLDKQNMATFFEGETFTGQEYLSAINVNSFGKLEGKISSLIIAGESPWTLYTGASYNGDTICIFPDSQFMDGTDGILNLGFYSAVNKLGLPDNSILSAKIGCFSENIANRPKLELEVETDQGGYGALI